jgi:hypothetical protein
MTLVILVMALMIFAPASAESAKDMELGMWTGPGGHRWVKFGNHTWRVLKVAVNEGRKEALLLAEEAVALMPFHRSKSSDNDWKTSDIRKWLNEDFYYSVFSKSEQDAILTAHYRYGGQNEGSDKTDSSKIFLLGTDEARNGDFFENDDDRTTTFDGKTWAWWLRSPGDIYCLAAHVRYHGEVHPGNSSDGFVFYERPVRPALIINLSSPIFTSSSSEYETLYDLHGSTRRKPLSRPPNSPRKRY